MARLTPQQIEDLRMRHRAIQFYGTPEQGYTDSGLWQFMSLVYTKDSHEKDPDKVRKPLMGDDPDYIKIALLYMLACQVLAIPKSRQMRVSWITTAFSVWHTMTAPYRHTIYQTKKENDAFAMVTEGAKNPAAGRMDFIIQHLPKWLRDPYIESGAGNKLGHLVFSPDPEDANGVQIPWQGSMINAIPQGAHQVRQYTPSLLISDESAFQEEYESSMIAARPAVHGGGKCISVSSVDAGSAFNRMVLESASGERLPHVVHPDVQRALDIIGMEWPKGLRSWLTPSGTWCLEIHYTADPAKDPERDGAEWVAEAVKGYVGGFDSPGWKTEMEIDYNAGGGDPVFPYLDVPTHPIYIPSIEPDEAIARFDLHAGFDWGANNPSAFIVWGVDYNGDIYALSEIYYPCTNLSELAADIKANPYFPHIKTITCDPSIMPNKATAAQGISSISEQFSDHGINFLPGRKAADLQFAHRLRGEYWANPTAPRAFLTADVPNLISEMKDLRWEKHISDAVAQRKNKLEKIRDKDNHAFDASAYCIDTRPRLYVGPVVPSSSGNKTMNDLIMQADKRLRDKNRRKSGISYFA